MTRITVFLLILIFTAGCTNQNNLIHRKSIAVTLGIDNENSITKTRNGVYVIKDNTIHNSVGFDPFAKRASSETAFGPGSISFQ